MTATLFQRVFTQHTSLGLQLTSLGLQHISVELQCRYIARKKSHAEKEFQIASTHIIILQASISVWKHSHDQKF